METEATPTEISKQGNGPVIDWGLLDIPWNSNASSVYHKSPLGME